MTNDELNAALAVAPGRTVSWAAAARLVDALAPGLTALRRDGTTRALRTVLCYCAAVAADRRRLEQWRARPRATRGRRPGRLTIPAFLYKWHRQQGDRVSRRTFARWIRRYRQTGAAGLIDGRGAWKRASTRADVQLFAELLRRVAAGAPVAVAWRELAPAAREQGIAWPALRSMQERVAAVRPFIQANAELLGAPRRRRGGRK
ncbi:MAG: helix-turn-helix domain-containing protein [Phycisphaerae bacterium]|jgi:hypothetical protein